jgi:hypothetical protein
MKMSVFYYYYDYFSFSISVNFSCLKERVGAKVIRNWGRKVGGKKREMLGKRI